MSSTSRYPRPEPDPTMPPWYQFLRQTVDPIRLSYEIVHARWTRNRAGEGHWEYTPSDTVVASCILCGHRMTGQARSIVAMVRAVRGHACA